jgi:hypothetical protein
VPGSTAIAAVTLDKLAELLVNFAFLAGGTIWILRRQLLPGPVTPSVFVFALGLLAALYLPLSFLSDYRSLVRWGLMGYTALTILLWILIGQRGLSAYLDKLIEVVLIVLLWLESRPAAR